VFDFDDAIRYRTRRGFVTANSPRDLQLIRDTLAEAPADPRKPGKAVVVA
jgi:hypothetical protein